MIDISKGRYWDEGIQLIDGCTPCSPGCEHCWSEAQAQRWNKFVDTDGNPFIVEGGKFTGQIKTWPERLLRLNTRKPKVFAIWNDLFHKDVPNEFINDVFLRMWHNDNTFLVLTKRAKRLANFIDKECSSYAIGLMDNVYYGLTVCNQKEADEKIPIFLQVPGKKFLSIEPMLGEIDIEKACCEFECFQCFSEKINAVILGGETGAGARPLHPDWVRSARDQCDSAGVPFFFKQWGEWTIRDSKIHGGIPKNPTVRLGENGLDTRDLTNCINCGNEVYMQRVGRNKAGRELDGRTHDDLPWVKEGK